MQRDLTKVSEETDDLNLDLREERVRLLTAKVKAQGGNSHKHVSFFLVNQFCFTFSHCSLNKLINGSCWMFHQFK